MIDTIQVIVYEVFLDVCPIKTKSTQKKPEPKGTFLSIDNNGDIKARSNSYYCKTFMKLAVVRYQGTVRVIGLFILGVLMTDIYLMDLLAARNQAEIILLMQFEDFETEEEKNETEENEKEEFQFDNEGIRTETQSTLLSEGYNLLMIRSYCHYLEIVTPPPES